jgi:tRNA pseudouridine55 synthase
MENGILLLDKDPGMTSREVDNALQKKFATSKVGHLGTLDPFATGLLIVGIDRGTKFLPYLDDSRKSYLASLQLGISTSTGDPEGEKGPVKAIPELTEANIAGILHSMLGPSEQIPPMTSAIKVNGEELYKAAHRGEVKERVPRKIEVFSLNLIEYKEGVVVFTCTVSRGTYIRVLGEDLAAKLGTAGYLLSLRRLSVGIFDLTHAHKLADLSEKDLIDPTVCVNTMKHVEADTEWVHDIKNGKALTLSADYGEKVLLCLHGEALAVYKKVTDKYYVAERGLFA